MRKKLQTINYTNGDKYYCEIKKNKKHGFGTFTWKDGKMNGTFIFKDKKGKKRKELWKDDNFIKLIK